MTDRMTGALEDERLDDRAVMGALAVVAGITVLAGPRHTRPLAGFLYGVALSRVHAAARARLEATLLRLFDERSSAHAAISALDRRLYGEHGIVDELDRRVADLEMIAGDAGDKGFALPEAHVRVRRRVYAATGRDREGRPFAARRAPSAPGGSRPEAA
jgi:hypothetical protein